MQAKKLLLVWGLLVLVFGCSASFGQPPSIEEIVTLKRVTAVELAPDGERIAYLVRVPRTPYEDDDGPPYQELYVTDLQGGTRPYVSGEVNVSAVAWSVDGAILYYLAKRDDDDEFASLYAIPVDGGESRKVYERGRATNSHYARDEHRYQN